jgi:hypothetical protein
MTESWRVRRIRSRFARGLIDSGQGYDHDLRRVYPSEEAALLRVAEDLARIAAEYRIDPEPVAARKGSNTIVVTADAADAVYIITKRTGNAGGTL